MRLSGTEFRDILPARSQSLWQEFSSPQQSTKDEEFSSSQEEEWVQPTDQYSATDLYGRQQIMQQTVEGSPLHSPEFNLTESPRRHFDEYSDEFNPILTSISPSSKSTEKRSVRFAPSPKLLSPHQYESPRRYGSPDRYDSPEQSESRIGSYLRDGAKDNADVLKWREHQSHDAMNLTRSQTFQKLFNEDNNMEYNTFLR